MLRRAYLRTDLLATILQFRNASVRRLEPSRLVHPIPKLVPPAQRWQSSSSSFRRKDVVPTADTIYALSSAPGRAAIAVIRISGPACIDIYGGLCPDRPFPTPRVATVRKLCEPGQDGGTRVLDNAALVLYFPAPHTVTGEDILELHTHGGPAIVKSVLEALPKCFDARPRRRTAEYSMIRPAEPGEFTKRAFYNGRLDLTQAEALGEALTAETEQQRRLAVMGAENGLNKRYEEWRQMLLYARGELEALIDFSEDQHFDESPAEFIRSVTVQILALQRQLRLHIQNASKGELLRNGISVALLGAPNAGKSSLLNRIVGREAAIVSAEEGTTRDIVDVSVDIQGWLCRLGDMAGLRSHDRKQSGRTEVGAVEREGIRRARDRALQSDVVVVLLSIEETEGDLELIINSELQQAVVECTNAGKTLVVVVNKIDLLPKTEAERLRSQFHDQVMTTFPTITADHIFLISCRQAQNETQPSDPGRIQAFMNGLISIFSRMTMAQIDEGTVLSADAAKSYWNASLSITHRQSTYLTQCLAHLDDFIASTGNTSLVEHHIDGHEDLVGEVQKEVDIVTAAEHLRYAASCLAKITGKAEGDIEDVLGVVFEK